jgi:DNA-directed RNA polymerase subunit L
MRQMRREINLIKERVQRIEVEAREANATLINLLDKI